MSIESNHLNIVGVVVVGVGRGVGPRLGENGNDRRLYRMHRVKLRA